MTFPPPVSQGRGNHCSHINATQRFKQCKPLGRFTSAFAERLCPMTIILRRDVADRLRETDAVQGFRDILVLCSVPRARALCILHKNNPGRITYSNSFW